MEGFWLTGFPVPPSENQLYRNVQRIGRVKTAAFRAYDKEVEHWAWQHQRELIKLRNFSVLKPTLSLEILLRMPHASFFTKDGRVKRMDATNRLKAPLDALAKLIELDDSHFWHVSIRKVPSVQECMDFYICPFVIAN